MLVTVSFEVSSELRTAVFAYLLWIAVFSEPAIKLGCDCSFRCVFQLVCPCIGLLSRRLICYTIRLMRRSSPWVPLCIWIFLGVEGMLWDSSFLRLGPVGTIRLLRPFLRSILLLQGLPAIFLLLTGMGGQDVQSRTLTLSPFGTQTAGLHHSVTPGSFTNTPLVLSLFRVVFAAFLNRLATCLGTVVFRGRAPSWRGMCIGSPDLIGCLFNSSLSVSGNSFISSSLRPFFVLLHPDLRKLIQKWDFEIKTP